jgi:hypothetical protein
VFYQECPFCARHHVTVQTALAASNALNRLPWNTKNDKLEIRSNPETTGTRNRLPLQMRLPSP